MPQLCLHFVLSVWKSLEANWKYSCFALLCLCLTSWPDVDPSDGKGKMGGDGDPQIFTTPSQPQKHARDRAINDKVSAAPKCLHSWLFEDSKCKSRCQKSVVSLLFVWCLFFALLKGAFLSYGGWLDFIFFLYFIFIFKDINTYSVHINRIFREKLFCFWICMPIKAWQLYESLIRLMRTIVEDHNPLLQCALASLCQSCKRSDFMVL